MLCGELTVLQAPMLDSLSLDPFTLFELLPVPWTPR
jgi:hypothetical protein